MFILLKIIIIIVVLAAISPFVGMAAAFYLGSLAAPGVTDREQTKGQIIVIAIIALIYLGFPALVFLL